MRALLYPLAQQDKFVLRKWKVRCSCISANIRAPVRWKHVLIFKNFKTKEFVTKDMLRWGKIFVHNNPCWFGTKYSYQHTLERKINPFTIKKYWNERKVRCFSLNSSWNVRNDSQSRSWKTWQEKLFRKRHWMWSVKERKWTERKKGTEKTQK